jgi:chromate transporter
MRAPGSVTVTPTPYDLFTGFLRVALCGFGGVLYWARRVSVEERRWLSETEFVDVMSLCQFMPGPNTLNLAMVLGLRFCGWRGALAGFAGLMFAPFLIILAMGVFYTSYGNLPLVQSVLRGVAAVAAGMLVAMGLKMAMVARIRNVLCLVGIAAFVAVAVLRFPLVQVLLALAPAGIALAWWRERGAPRPPASGGGAH